MKNLLALNQRSHATTVSEEQEFPVVFPAAAAVSPAIRSNYNNRLYSTRTLAERNELYRVILHAFNSNSSTNGKIPLSGLKSRWSALCAAFRYRNDRLSATGTAPFENWAHHVTMENATREVPTVILPTVYTSLARETIDIRGQVVGARQERTVEDNGADEGVTRGAASRSRAVNRTMEYLVTSMNEIEARCFELGEPERITFNNYLARSRMFFGETLESLERQEQVQSRIADQM
ncbi:uncharacterized protein EV154DRAFT_481543 [Mucor mucedo]|uniref:uncharacterized protein n=1 Tax=Mucor mucedo TaxID=29922 RepID=UPI00221FFC35|nr:uncharacterized protein EV154DRAFT_481543 [Mucor mucedo]KAI7891143.1 hypothetical protein EV154DRAFT_481543 [Mucor mucedo]